MSNEDDQLRLVALKNAKEILAARQRVEQDLVQAKEALEAKTSQLAHSLAFVSATLDAIGDGVVAIDADGRVSHYNGTFCRMWGLSPAQLDTTEPELLRLMSERCVDSLAFRQPRTSTSADVSLEHVELILLANGTAFERYSRSLNVGNAQAGRVWSFRDVTQRRAIEEHQREETRMLELLNETGAALTSELNVEDLIQSVTNTATRLCRAEFGAFFFNATNDDGESFTLYTLAGAPREAFDKFPLPRATAIFGPTFRGERIVRFDDVRLSPDFGKSAPYYGMPEGHLPVRSYLAVPVKSRDGVVHGGLFFGHSKVGVFTPRDELTMGGVAFQAAVAIDNVLLLERTRHLNDTLQQQVEQRTAELMRSEMQFQQLIAGVTDYAIYMIDPEGKIVSWNPGAERIKGYSSAEIIGKSFSQFYTDEDREAGMPRKALDTALARGKFEGEAWRVRKDGTHFWANVLIDPIRDATGKHIGFAKVTRDMTDYRLMQERLHQSQKMEAIGQLTGGVAHDFNNLLTVILGNLDALRRHLPQDETRLRRAVEQANRGAQRAATLTQQLLAFARRQPLNPKPCDINRLVADMSDLLRRTLGENISIETVLAGGLWRVDVDPNQLESAILNLAVNSRDAMTAGGKLTIETANAYLDDEYATNFAEIAPGQYVLLCVSDTGTGMPREVLTRAFDPFFTTKPIGQGTGLGLSQVYGFVKQSNGHIKLYSEPGDGTTVKIYLPRLTQEVLNDEPPQPLIAPEGRAAETILVVEDDDDVRMYSTESLRELKFTVLEAASAEDALRILEAHPGISLLFTDVGLPGRNGRELVEAARRIRPDLKVLFTTGYARNAIVHQGRLDAGVQLLTKPFTRAQLAIRVREILDTNTAAAEPRRKVILVAEDEEVLRVSLVETLNTLGFEVLEAATAAQAVSLAGSATPAAAILDVGLPDRSGIDVALELRQQIAGLPIVIVSGYGSAGGRLAHEAQVAWLTKPFEGAALAEALERLGIVP